MTPTVILKLYSYTILFRLIISFIVPNRLSAFAFDLRHLFDTWKHPRLCLTSHKLLFLDQSLCKVLMSFILPVNFIGNYIFVIVINLSLSCLHVWPSLYNFNKQTLVFNVNPFGLIFFGYQLVVTKVF